MKEVMRPTVDGMKADGHTTGYSSVACGRTQSDAVEDYNGNRSRTTAQQFSLADRVGAYEDQGTYPETYADRAHARVLQGFRRDARSFLRRNDYHRRACRADAFRGSHLLG